MSPAVLGLARSQETLWEFVSCFAPSDPGRLGYNVFDVTTWDGTVDPDLFRQAVVDVMRRHDALRIVFTDISLDPSIRIAEEVDTTITFADLSALPEARQQAQRASLLGYERTRAFDLRSGPLWRASLLRLREDRHLVAVSMFHLIADGWSTGVFLRDLRTAYRARVGQGPGLAPLRLSYDAAMGLTGAAGRGAGSDPAAVRRRAEFWRRTLTPLPEVWPYEPALDSPDADVGASASIGAPIGAQLVDRLHGFARRQRVTPFLLFLAAYRILLGVRTGWPRVVIGTATAGRDAPGAEDLVGQFTQNIYISSVIAPTVSLIEAIGIVRSAMYEAMRHTASFSEIARAVNPEFDDVRPWPFLLLYHSWFQSAAPEAEPSPPPGLHEHRGRMPLPGDRAAATPRLWAKRGEPGLVVRHDRRGALMNYNPTLYPREAMVSTLRGYTAVLTALLADPHQRVGDLRPG
jgi:hypothetical protein